MAVVNYFGYYCQKRQLWTTREYREKHRCFNRRKGRNKGGKCPSLIRMPQTKIIHQEKTGVEA